MVKKKGALGILYFRSLWWPYSPFVGCDILATVKSETMTFSKVLGCLDKRDGRVRMVLLRPLSVHIPSLGVLWTSACAIFVRGAK